MRLLKQKQGFTLIELIMVIAILAIVALVGIHSFGNLKEIQAKKVNLATIKQTSHALETYQVICQENSDTGYFNGFDSLIDAAQSSGEWKGTEGTYQWSNNQVSGTPGIYSGSWKYLLVVKNAMGQGSDTPPTLADTMEKNRGTRDTGLTFSGTKETRTLGIYFLSTNDVSLLQNAGITWNLLHNPSTAQSRSFAATDKITDIGNYVINGGGPGFRPDMSAYYPQVLTNGSPVAIINPATSTGRSIYADLGYAKAATNDTDDAATALVSGQTDKLLVFGIGKSAQCVISKFGLGDAPVDQAYNMRNYRYYLAVFAISTRGQGTASTCHLAGVLDCRGKTYRQAEYDVNWTTSMN